MGDILPSMQQFATVREAKEYLIARIVAQAGHDGIPLSEVERKMLYFSETGWTLPDMMQVNAEFDQNYEQDEFEAKIADVVKSIHMRNEDLATWNGAVRRLCDEDHYLLALIDGARTPRSKRPPNDILKLLLTACLVIAVAFAVTFFVDSHVSDRAEAKLVGSILFLALLVGAALLTRRR